MSRGRSSRRGRGRSGRAEQPTRRRPTVDACLIVRDEAENLPACLESLKRLGDRLTGINVYDTGSTDETVRIAREAGCTVVEGHWDDDFARARNESLALSTADWSIVIDADERIVADLDRLTRALQKLGAANVIDAELYHLGEAGERTGHTRYIKMVKAPEIRFAHPVHEVVAGFTGHAVTIASLDPHLLHFSHLGYASAEVRRRKVERNLRLADVAVQRARADGDRVLLAHSLRHRARSRTGAGGADAAVLDFREAWALWRVGCSEWVTTGLDIAHRQVTSGDVGGAATTVAQLRDAGVAPRLWQGLEAEGLLRRGDLAGARAVVDAVLAVPVPTVDGDAVHGPYLDRREALDLRLRIALEGQEHAVAVAVCILLIGQGEVERTETLCALWMRSATALAAALDTAVTGPHGAAVVQALAAHPGVGAAAAARLRELVAPQATGATADGKRDPNLSTEGRTP